MLGRGKMVGFLRSLHDTLRIWNIPVPPLEHWDMRTLLNAVGQFHPPFHCNILYSPLVLCGKQNLKNKCSRPTFNKYFWSPSIAPLYQVYGEKFLNAKLRYPRYSWQVFSHHYINIPSSLGNLRTHISIGAPGIKSDQRAPGMTVASSHPQTQRADTGKIFRRAFYVCTLLTAGSNSQDSQEIYLQAAFLFSTCTNASNYQKKIISRTLASKRLSFPISLNKRRKEYIIINSIHSYLGRFTIQPVKEKPWHLSYTDFNDCWSAGGSQSILCEQECQVVDTKHDTTSIYGNKLKDISEECSVHPYRTRG